MKYYSISEFAKKIRVTEQTLRNWDKKGTFKPHHTSDYGKRFYSQEQLNDYLGINPVEVSDRKVIGYCRVSSHKQKDDLTRQIENVRMYMIAKGYQFEIITDIGNGINYDKKGLKKLLKMIQSNKVEKVVILYKDRLLRLGFELFENICNYNNTKIEIIDSTNKIDEEELVEDLVQIITVFSCRLQGKRAKKTRRIIKELAENDKSEES
ncbi:MULTISPECIES: IS607 family transposase [unclassified Clostridioides]|uniref:IS607 family transposase n=1 Tax=unclassified Clostridioides TaxID=2635829 RepID=UPI001D1289A5|nr:IS607 family transposase [Clostridioides sp. ZZV14-6150]MCC0661950.1 IS607 family transposase [Clostridioides sp. ZZV14-6154]MCC0670007.1 IS607 family transposase [Clostridioides sp. ZZV14-6153]MCC0719186.1 IS607 family transposase [Clostridioides sp. ZZV14-6105]MCC0724049.1 IS607 family transposase [Clostridioides sp. ZZV14-6104]MCC0726112.1 IS607 family transposase [Clostridioides sp. ZZV14-6045]MCC0730857.1 IS607 family transposase [Clostridioides sp. ZZV14-6048]MCC0735793.1 IS607 fami